MPTRIIVNVRGGLVQDVKAEADKVSVEVLDHDNWECAVLHGNSGIWTHDRQCTDHSAEDFAGYVALCNEFDTLPVTVY